MMQNKIRQLWLDNKPVLNGWLSIPAPFSAEIMADQDYDALTIDMQHGVIGYDAAVTMLQAIRAGSAAPLVRVPWLDAAEIMKALDAGAHGLICPMISTKEQAVELASYTRYPPYGERSFGPTRALFSVGRDYAAAADDFIVCLAMIETQQAFDNLADILSVDGIDGVYIGPADLTLGLTGRKYRTGFDREEPEMIEAIQHIAKTAHQFGKKAGLHCGSADYAAKAISWGLDLVTLSNDVRLLAGAAAQSVGQFRSLLGAAAPENIVVDAKGGY